MKPILPVLVAAASVAIWSGSCEAQYGYPVGYPTNSPTSYATSGTPRYASGMQFQPQLTSMAVFQDGSVPIPNDTTVMPNHSGAPVAGQGSAPGSSVPAGVGSSAAQMSSGAEACCGVPMMTSPAMPDSMTWNAFAPPFTADPFLGGMANPAAPQTSGQPTVPQGLYSYGANGPQPYRFGWNNRIDFSWMPDSNFSDPAQGSFQYFGIDYGLTHTSQLPSGCVLNWTNQFAYRNLSGGPIAGGFNVPGSLFRFGFDIEMETQSSGPASLSFAITPSINTDFDADPWNEGFQLDARGIALFRLDPYWTLGLGAMYWDRLNDRVIPWAGLIYRDDYWEWQLMYPETRVSLFLGNERLWAKWIYFRAEYHVEAYGVQRNNGGVQQDTQMELSDYRLLGGFRMDAGFYSWFIEAGAVLDRNLEYGTSPQSTGVGSGFIGQIGLRF